MFNQVDISKYSQIVSAFSLSDDATILVAKFSGLYTKGSMGNSDGVFMYSMLASYYFAFEPITIILDLSQLDYQWGNTIYTSINFFDGVGRDESEKQKKMIVLLSDKNVNAIMELDKSLIGKGQRVFCNSLLEAVDIAEKEVKSYLQ
jgi:hypothetical protein